MYFKLYVLENNTENTILFRKKFINSLDIIPSYNVSSKKLIRILEIKSEIDKKIFKKTYNEFFKYKIITKYKN